jgi:hypothetical protein
MCSRHSFASSGIARAIAVVGRRDEWENTFGDDLIQELRDEMVFVDDSNQVARLAALAAPLIKTVLAGKTQFKCPAATTVEETSEAVGIFAIGAD